MTLSRYPRAHELQQSIEWLNNENGSGFRLVGMKYVQNNLTKTKTGSRAYETKEY
jgi:hypothetical protein